MRICFTVRGMEGNFIEALAAAARQAREDQGISREEVAVALGASVDKVRYFENARAFDALNEILAAYSATTKRSIDQLLEETREHLKKKG